MSESVPGAGAQVEIISEDLAIAFGELRLLCSYGCSARSYRLVVQYKMRSRSSSPLSVRAVFPIVGHRPFLNAPLRLSVTQDGDPLFVDETRREAIEEPFRKKWNDAARRFISRHPDYHRMLEELGRRRDENSLAPIYLQVYIANKLRLKPSTVSILNEVHARDDVEIRTLSKLMADIAPESASPLVADWGLPADLVHDAHDNAPTPLWVHSYRLSMLPGRTHVVTVEYEGLASDRFFYAIRPALAWAAFNNLAIQVSLPLGADFSCNLELHRRPVDNRIVLAGFFESPQEDLLINLDGHTRGAATSKDWRPPSQVLAEYRANGREKFPGIEGSLAKLVDSPAARGSLMDRATVGEVESLPWLELVPFLWTQVCSGNFYREREAARLIGLAPTRQAAFLLLRLLSHQDAYVRLNAEMGLEREVGQALSEFPGDLLPARVKKAARILADRVREPDWYAANQVGCEARFSDSGERP